MKKGSGKVKTPYHGVVWDAYNKHWYAFFKGKRIGTFTSDVHAAKAFDAYQRRFNKGKDNRLNFPQFGEQPFYTYIDGNIVRIPLNMCKETICDISDFESVKQYNWSYSWGYSKQPNCENVHSCINGKNISLSQFLNPNWIQTDHINHNRLDNRRCNLREATSQQQKMNRIKVVRAHHTSKYKGVHWNTRKKRWIAKIRYNLKTFVIGHFRDEVEAAQSYNQRAKELFGEFACLNVIEGEG